MKIERGNGGWNKSKRKRVVQLDRLSKQTAETVAILYGLVGMRYIGTDSIVAALPHGHPVLLIRDPENPVDPNAVQVWANDRHIGFIKSGQVERLARRLDSPTWHQCSRQTGRPCINGALMRDRGRWPLIEVEDGA